MSVHHAHHSLIGSPLQLFHRFWVKDIIDKKIDQQKRWINALTLVSDRLDIDSPARFLMG
jgi:hypothetical protein